MGKKRKNKKKGSLLRVDGINIGNVIGDTNQLSVSRGASLLLRQAVIDLDPDKRAAEEPELPQGAKVISSGASVGEFQLPELSPDEASALTDRIEVYLAGHPRYRHLSFGVVTEPFGDNDDNKPARERALARMRFLQMRQPALVTPPRNFDADRTPCAWDGRSPADGGTIKREGEEPIAVSRSVRDRYEYGAGVAQKQAFYRAEAGMAEDHPAYWMRYTKDLSELADDRRSGPLDGKIAVIYADGNRFSDIRNETCRKFTQLTKFDDIIKAGRRRFLHRLCGVLANDPPSLLTGGDTIRLETLLWGGDELMLVVPASRGFAVLQLLFQELADWSYTGQPPWPLTQSAGIVFCPASTPIVRARTLAEDLANGVKTRLKAREAGATCADRVRSTLRNAYDYFVLESIDYPTENDLDDLMRARYGPVFDQRRPLAPVSDWGGITRLPGAADDWQQRLGDFPKSQAYRIARAAAQADWGAEAAKDALETYREALQRMHAVVEDADTFEHQLSFLFGARSIPDVDPTGGDEVPTEPWPWIHLAELWDYLAPSTAGTQDAAEVSP